MLSINEIISAVATSIVVGANIYYLYAVLRRRVKPHVFSWLIWEILMLIGFAVQYTEKTGPGMWVLAGAAVVDFVIVIAALSHGEKSITRSDWIMFICALVAIPVWRMTNDPLWAALMISAIDACAFWPTFRKSWLKPREESMAFFFMGGMPFWMSIAAMDNPTFTAAVYPGTIAMLNTLLALMLLYRRRLT